MILGRLYDQDRIGSGKARTERSVIEVESEERQEGGRVQSPVGFEAERDLDERAAKRADANREILGSVGIQLGKIMAIFGWPFLLAYELQEFL
jgi:hypothetical protein